MDGMSLRIRQARTRARLTQTELSRRVGVQRSAVTQWERENGTSPSVHHLTRIARETSVPFEWLATGRRCNPEDDAALADALLMDDFARDATESRALLALRRLHQRKREPLVRLLELLSS